MHRAAEKKEAAKGVRRASVLGSHSLSVVLEKKGGRGRKVAMAKPCLTMVGKVRVHDGEGVSAFRRRQGANSGMARGYILALEMGGSTTELSEGKRKDLAGGEFGNH